MKEDIKKEFQLGNVKVELSKADLESMLKELDKEEVVYDYPICCKSKSLGLVVLFNEPKEGLVLRSEDNEIIPQRTIHRFKHGCANKDYWEQIPYDKERGLYHGQWVWCWDDNEFGTLSILKYDAINKRSFDYNGEGTGFIWDNYSATCPEHMKEAFQDLINNEKALGTVGIEF